MVDESEILIPSEKLSEGFKDCRELIISLLSDGKTLYNSKKYSSSIALSILAHEEVGKLNLINNVIKSKSGIRKIDWENNSKPGSHTSKGTAFYSIALDDLKKMGETHYNQIIIAEKKRDPSQQFHSYSELLQNESRIRKHLKTLNEIKKACLYLDWKNSNWFKISKIYSEHELQLLANYLLDLVGYEFYSELISKKYPLNFYYTIPPEISLMRKDPIWLQREEYSKRVYGDEQYNEFIKAVNYLIDTFPNKSFKFVS